MEGTALRAAQIYQQYGLDQHAIITMTDATGLITYVNDKFCTLSGYSRNELIGENHRILNSNNQPKTYWESMYQSLRDDKIWHDEVKNKAKDGHIYWVDTTIIPIFDSRGDTEAFVAIRTDITEQKKISNTLLNQTFAMENHSIIAMTDLKGNITYVNNKFCEVSGYTKQELMGKNHRLLNSENKPDSYWKAMYQTVIKGHLWHDEVKNKAKDGHYYWVDTTIIPFMDIHGKPEKYVSIRTDITQKKELGEALINQRFAMNQHSIIATTDVTGKITYANDKFCQISGYSMNELLGENHNILNSNHQPSAYWKSMYKTVSKGKVWKDEVKNIAKDGSYYWVDTSIIPFLNDNGKPNSYISIRTDITALKKIEEILLSQRFAMDQHSIIAMTDVTGNIIYANDKFCDISGYSKMELMGQNHRILNSQHQPKSYWKAMYKTLAKEGMWQAEVKNRAKDGTYYWVDTTIVPFMNANGKPDSYISIRTDITKFKQIQEELEVHQKELELRILQRTDELEEANKALKVLSENDPLTKLANRRGLTTQFDHQVKMAERTHRTMALFFIDLDHFKAVNDKLGHNVGDALLQLIAEIMTKQLRGEDYLYRIGGDEFCVLVSEYSHKEDLAHIAQRIIKSISEITCFNSVPIKIGCSIGIATFPDNATSLTNLLSCADQAMYQIKESDKGHYQFSNQQPQ